MSFLKFPFWEVVKHAFSQEVWDTVFPAVWDTLYMVALSAVITLVLGILLGIGLSVISKDGVRPVSVLNETAGTIVNCLHSLPSMIMIIVTLPLARALLGQSYGSNACIIALAASCIPMYARLVQDAFVEIPKGKIEAAKAMGSSSAAIVFRIMLPEAIPSIILCLKQRPLSMRLVLHLESWESRASRSFRDVEFHTAHFVTAHFLKTRQLL